MGGIAPGPKPILRCRALMQTLEPSEEASHRSTLQLWSNGYIYWWIAFLPSLW